MSVGHSSAGFAVDDTVFSAPDLRMHMLSASRWLSASEVKTLVRDAQHELTSAWKFYMGLGFNKHALVLVDSFTSLPLSVARHCATVVVYGMQEEETQLLQSLAASKQISNCSCVDELTSLRRPFDLIVLAVTGRGKEAGFPPVEEVRSLLHPHTEFWAVATNEFSLGYAKALLRSFWTKFRAPRVDTASHQPHGVRLQFGGRPLVLSQHVKRYCVTLGCKPSAEIGLRPDVVHMQTVRPVRHVGGGALLGSISALWQRRGAGEMVIGSGARTETGEAFLERFLQALPNSELSAGSLQCYRVSAGGKVLLFTRFRRRQGTCKTLVKLPLNAYTQRRLAINQAYLQFLAASDRIESTKHKYFPEPLAEGTFEGQPFYAESILEGLSGDAMRISHREQQRLIQEVFAFWTDIQQRFKKSCYFDYCTFSDLIETPLHRVFNSTDQTKSLIGALDNILRFLRDRFIHKEFLLSIVHGDFSMKNIMFNKEDLSISGIIDWDMANNSTFPVFDVFHFFVRMQEKLQDYSPVQILFQLLENPSSNLQKILQIYREKFCIENDMTILFFTMYWIHLLSGHVGSLKFLDKSFVRRNLSDPLQLIIKKIS